MDKKYLVNINSKSEIEKVIDCLVDITKDPYKFIEIAREDEFYVLFDYEFGESVDGKFKIYDYECADMPQHSHLYISKDKFLFYKKAFEYAFHSKVAQLVKNITKINYTLDDEMNPCECVWEDEENTFGLCAAGLLALENKEYIPLFADFIERNDLSHEVYQWPFAEVIFEKYGWIKETLYLLSMGPLSMYGSDAYRDHLSGKKLLDVFKKDGSLYDYFFKSLLEVLKGHNIYEDDSHMEDYEEIKCMVDEKLSPDEVFTVNLSRKKICLTGKAPLDREELKMILESEGAVIQKDIKDDTNILICKNKDKETSKLKKAKEKFIDIYTYDEIFNINSYNKKKKKLKADFGQVFKDSDIDKIKMMFEKYPFIMEFTPVELYHKALVDSKSKEVIDLLFNHFKIKPDDSYDILNLISNPSIYLRLDEKYAKDMLHYLIDNNIVKTKLNKEVDNPPVLELVKKVVKDNNKFIEIIGYILENGADINETDTHGVHPLYAAVETNSPNFDLIKFLIDNGAEINKSGRKRNTPLVALINNLGKCKIEEDDDKDDIIEKEENKTYLNEILNYLLDKGAKIDYDREGQSPFKEAVREGDLYTAKMFYEMENFDINEISDKYSDPPIYSAAMFGYPDVVKYLIGKGADVNLCNKTGMSPLMAAAMNGNLENIKILIKHGADPFHKDRLERGAIDLAKSKIENFPGIFKEKNTKVIEYLESLKK